MAGAQVALTPATPTQDHRAQKHHLRIGPTGEATEERPGDRPSIEAAARSVSKDSNGSDVRWDLGEGDEAAETKAGDEVCVGVDVDLREDARCRVEEKASSGDDAHSMGDGTSTITLDVGGAGSSARAVAVGFLSSPDGTQSAADSALNDGPQTHIKSRTATKQRMQVPTEHLDAEMAALLLPQLNLAKARIKELELLVKPPNRLWQFIAQALKPGGNPDDGSTATEPKVLAARISLSLGASLALAYTVIAACTQRVEIYRANGPHTLRNMRTLHAVFMSLAWCVLLPAGVVVARLYKDRHPSWFAAHTTLQTWGALFAIAGYTVGLKLASMPAHLVESTKAADTTAVATVVMSARLKGAGIASSMHSAVGTTAVVLLLWQIVLVTVLRPNNTGESKRRRRLWNLAHRWTGRSAIALGVSNCYLGLAMWTKLAAKPTIALSMAVAIVLLAHLFLEAKRYVDDAEDADEEEYAKVTADGHEYLPKRKAQTRWKATTGAVAAVRRMSRFMSSGFSGGSGRSSECSSAKDTFTVPSQQKRIPGGNGEGRGRRGWERRLHRLTDFRLANAVAGRFRIAKDLGKSSNKGGEVGNLQAMARWSSQDGRSAHDSGTLDDMKLNRVGFYDEDHHSDARSFDHHERQQQQWTQKKSQQQHQRQNERHHRHAQRHQWHHEGHQQHHHLGPASKQQDWRDFDPPHHPQKQKHRQKHHQQQSEHEILGENSTKLPPSSPTAGPPPPPPEAFLSPTAALPSSLPSMPTMPPTSIPSPPLIFPSTNYFQATAPVAKASAVLTPPLPNRGTAAQGVTSPPSSPIVSTKKYLGLPPALANMRPKQSVGNFDSSGTVKL